MHTDGVKIDLNNEHRSLAHCRHCGSCNGVLRSGSGPHAARVDCEGCGKFLNWAPFWFAAQMGLIERVEG